MERVLSGIQPTGQLHIGNYLGALKQWVALQQNYGCYYCIVDLHALTVKQDPKTFAQKTLNTVMDLLALGVDPERSPLFIQSQVPEHAELTWILDTLAPIGELERMTQFKEKAEQHATSINMGLLNYPVLQAADILLYKPAFVPIGEDQVQHVELTRDLARKFNKQFGETFPEPKPKLTKAARIMSLTDPAKKMSKSHSEKSYIALTDEPDVIRQKLNKAVTATAGGKNTDPGVENLFAMMHEVSSPEIVERFTEQQKNGSIRYAELKKQLAEDLIEHLAEFRSSKKELAKKESYVREVLEDGRNKAAKIAGQTMEEVRKKVGLLR